MGSNIALWIDSIFGTETGRIVGDIIIAMLPVVELRGAIPVAYAWGFSWRTAVVCALIGNMLPVPFILLFLDKVFQFMKEHNILKGLVERLEKKGAAKGEGMARFQFWGLALLVAIPLPGTGGWTGALIATVIKMDKKQALLAIAIGLVAAAAIVTALTYGVVGSLI